MLRVISVFSLALLFVTAIGCKKQELPTPAPNPAFAPLPDHSFMPLETGNKWFYDAYFVYPDGTEEFWRQDSLEVLGDSIVDMKRYAIINHGLVVGVGQNATLLRHSGNNLVTQYGTKLFSSDQLDTPISTSALPDWYALTVSMQKEKARIEVPAGKFPVIQRATNVYDLTQPQDSIRHAYAYFSRNVGIVSSQMIYLGAPQVIEYRLVRFEPANGKIR